MRVSTGLIPLHDTDCVQLCDETRALHSCEVYSTRARARALVQNVVKWFRTFMLQLAGAMVAVAHELLREINGNHVWVRQCKLNQCRPSFHVKRAAPVVGLQSAQQLAQCTGPR